MDSGYYAACAGMVSRIEALDTVANNLANVNTPGFRASRNVFGSLLTTAGNAPISVLNQDMNDYGVLSGTELDNSQGALSKTGNDLDFAIEGPGYFAVQTAGGLVYTRAGNFRVSPTGRLVTAQGDAVMGENGPLAIAGQPMAVSADGTITVNGAIAGRLKVVEFPAGTQMTGAGETYYAAPPGSAVASSHSRVQQGMLEDSNVNPLAGMVELITAQRDLESMRNVLTLFSGEMDKTAVQDLPRVQS
jgi:flagellar basal-body rod protein FlgF